MKIKEELNKSYVYLHRRLDTNDVFYVGIGTGKYFQRSKDKKGRSLHWKKIVNKVGYTIDIIYNNITWEQAKKYEINLIAMYGRRDLGLGNLVNHTIGGEGSVGVIVSDKTKEKLKKALKNVGLGKSKSEEHKKNMSIARTGEKRSPRSEETKEKIRNSLKGRVYSEERRKNISNATKGRVITEEQRLKLKESIKNRDYTKNEDTLRRLKFANQYGVIKGLIRPVKDLNTGAIYYGGLQEVSKLFNIKYNTLKTRVHSKYSNFKISKVYSIFL